MKKDSCKEPITTRMSYTMQYKCRNCGRDFIESFEYGEKASQGTCPHCGVSDTSMDMPNYIVKY